MTAVDFYRKELMALVSTDKTQFKTESEIFEKAKEMEKQQIIDSYIECKRQYIIKESCFPPQFVVKEAEQYYNETFNK